MKMVKNKHGCYPCPNCGYEDIQPEITFAPIYDDDHRTVQSMEAAFVVECPCFKCKPLQQVLYSNMYDAINMWNFECEQKMKEDDK